MGLALDLATANPDLSKREASFRLVRRLRQLSEDDPEQFEQAVFAFCEKTGRPREDFWYDFLVCWPKVRTAEGEDVLSWAANMAKQKPYTPTPCLVLQRYDDLTVHRFRRFRRRGLGFFRVRTPGCRFFRERCAARLRRWW